MKQAEGDIAMNSGPARRNTAVSPWIGAITRPDDLIRDLAADNPDYLVLLLSAACGIALGFALGLMDLAPLGTGYSAGLLYVVALAVRGILVVFLWSVLVTGLSVLAGGVGLVQTNRLALAWSRVPIIYAATLAYLIGLPDGGGFVQQAVDEWPVKAWLVVSLLALGYLLSVRTWIIMLAQVNRLTIGKSCVIVFLIELSAAGLTFLGLFMDD